MDFSEAERCGFIDAFVEFWQGQPGDDRSVEELIEAAGKLLRGCQEHFRAGVTRVSRISGAVPVESKDQFVARALSLLNAPDSDAYKSRAAIIASNSLQATT
jgi:hypothetical protein